MSMDDEKDFNPQGGQLTAKVTINVPGDHANARCRGAYTREQAELALWSYYRSLPMTWREAAAFFDVESAVLKKLWLGALDGAELTAALKAVAEVKESSGRNATPRYAMTSAARKFGHALEVALDTADADLPLTKPRIIFIAADAGAGKTTLLRAFAEANNHGRTCYWQPDRIGGLKHCVQELAALNNINSYVSYNDMLPRVQSCFDHRILIVDDAHTLIEDGSNRLRKLEFLLGLHDTRRVTIVMAAALDRFGSALSEVRYNHKQFFRRCRYKLILDDPASRKDVEALWTFHFPRLALPDELRTILEALNAHAQGGFGAVAAVLDDVRRFADKRGERVGAPVALAVASEQLADLEKLGKLIGTPVWQRRAA
jgi:DNA transposition AAA+ family ATPase